MSHTIYQLEYDHPDAPPGYAGDMAITTVETHILPATRFTTVNRTDNPVASLTSEQGEAYIRTALMETQAVITTALRTIYTALCEDVGEQDSLEPPEDVFETGGATTLQRFFQDEDVVRAVRQVASQRGESRYLYGLRYAYGIPTRSGLQEHLDLYGLSETDDEFIVVVPLELTEDRR